jgi:hypothetical protein
MPQVHRFRPWKSSRVEDPLRWTIGRRNRDRTSIRHHRDRLTTIALAAASRRAAPAQPLPADRREHVGSGRNVSLVDPAGGRHPAGTSGSAGKGPGAPADQRPGRRVA